MIRMIQKKDIPEILNIYNWYIENSTATFETEKLTLEEFSERVDGITKKYPWIVLEEESRVIGYAYLSAFNTRSAYDWTCDLAIYLDHEVRGKGYGTQLIRKISDIAKRDGYKKMVSLVTSGNTASEHLHEKNGFINAGYLANTGYKNNQWLGVTFFLKDLCPLNENPEKPQNLDVV